MEHDSPIAALIDATGGGACRLGEGGVIVAFSPGFARLTGIVEADRGRPIAEVVASMPSIDAVPDRAPERSASFAQIGADGVRRRIAPARVMLEGAPWIVLVDRSGEERLERTQAKLGRQIDDLKSELRTRARAPIGPRLRSMRELAARLEDALQRAHRYKHDVTVLHVGIQGSMPAGAGTELLACVRGVDDVGEAGGGAFVVMLPHTALAGANIVASRILDRLGEAAGQGLGIGVAQAKATEGAGDVAERAEQACAQALGRGGGVLLAVDVL